MLCLGFCLPDRALTLRGLLARLVSPTFSHVVVADLDGNCLTVCPPMVGPRIITLACDVVEASTAVVWAAFPCTHIPIDAQDVRGLTCVRSAHLAMHRRGIRRPPWWVQTPRQLFRWAALHPVEWFTYVENRRITIKDASTSPVD